MYHNVAKIYAEAPRRNTVKSLGRRDTVWWIIAPPCGAFDLGLAVSVPLPIVMGIFVLLWFQSRLT